MTPKNWTLGGGESKILKICQMSFMDIPLDKYLHICHLNCLPIYSLKTSKRELRKNLKRNQMASRLYLRLKLKFNFGNPNLRLRVLEELMSWRVASKS